MSDTQARLLRLDALLAADPSNAKAHAARADMLLKKGVFPLAVKAFQQALTCASPTDLQHRAWCLAHRGSAYRLWHKSYFEEALNDFDAALALVPDYVWALGFRARVLELLRRYDEALEAFDKAVKLDRNIIPHWRAERGMLLGFLGKPDEARLWFRKALEENPRDHFAAYGMATSLGLEFGLVAAKQEIADAKALLRALCGGPDTGIALYRLAGLAALAEQGSDGMALRLLAASLPLEREAIEFARHDLVWQPYHQLPEFVNLVTDHLGDLTRG